jgi:hypothetical protein
VGHAGQGADAVGDVVVQAVTVAAHQEPGQVGGPCGRGRVRDLVMGGEGVGGAPDVAPGRIVALDQSITASDESGGSSGQLKGLIQVDADIQAGDSGGALANDSGQVVGVNTAASTGYELGRGGRQVGGTQEFAIPINQALDVAKQIESGNGTATVHIGETAILGVTVADTAGGAGIQDVLINGPAAGAAITGGSVITAIEPAFPGLLQAAVGEPVQCEGACGRGSSTVDSRLRAVFGCRVEHGFQHLARRLPVRVIGFDGDQHGPGGVDRLGLVGSGSGASEAVRQGPGQGVSQVRRRCGVDGQ